MGKVNLNYSVPCFLCGSIDTVTTEYLGFNSFDLKRNFAYAIPTLIADLLCSISRRFSLAYYPVSINKKYFSRLAVYCRNCLTGSCHPNLSKEMLANYYQKFYWNNRDFIDGQHVALDDRPNDLQLALTYDRIAWIDKFLPRVESMIDFGGGDCAAAFTYRKRMGVQTVHVVDPSVRASALAVEYGVGYSEDLRQAPVVDLIYSAHSIEHVPDFIESIRELLTKVQVGGYFFFETPNIGDMEIFKSLCHTPHTFMLSARSFQFLQKIFPVKIIGIECCGPAWQKNRKTIKSVAKADLRVLLQHVSNV